MADIIELGMDVDSRPIRMTREEMGRFVREGKNVDKSAKGVERSTAAMAAGMRKAHIAIAATVGALAGLAGSARLLANFEKQISTVGAVSRATSAELDAMRKIAVQLGSTTEFTGVQAAEGLEFLARAGFTAAESVQAIPDVLDLATASAMGLGQASDIASNIMSAFGIQAENTASATDILAAASSRANTDVAQLGTAMSFVGPVASSLDIAMSDTAAAIGVLSDAGIQGSTAGTSLRRTLSSLANPTSEAEKVLSDLGLTMEQLNPQTNSIVEIVDRLAIAGIDAADALTVFGDRGGPAILALTSQTGRLRELTEQLTDVDGEAKRMAETMRDNLGGDIDSAVSAMQGLILALGEAGLTAVLRSVIQGVTGFVRGVTELVNVVGAGIDVINSFVSGMSDQEMLDRAREAALDSVTVAMGDQMRASVELQRVIEGGLESSIAVIRAKIEEARARREVVQEMVAERQERALEELGYLELLGQIRSAQDAVRGMAGSENQVPLDMRQQYEDAQQALVALRQEQQQMLEDVRAQGFLREEEAAHLETIEGNIRALEDRMSRIKGETGETVELTERFSVLANQLNFDRATQSASLLAAQLGLGLEAAVGMSAALNRAAGIEQAQQSGLRFPGGTPNGSAPGSFTGAGGELVFGNLDGPNPADFIPDSIRNIGGSAGGGAGALREEADAARDVVRELQKRIDLIGATSEERRLDQALQRAGVDLMSEEGQKIADLVEEYERLQGAQKLNEEIAGSLKGAILDFAEGGEDALGRLADAFKRMALEAALFGEGPFGSLLGGQGGQGLLGGLISSISGGIAGRYAGAFDSGGHIPAGMVGLVGEKRPEFVSGPANVTGGEATARMMQGSSVSVPIQVNIEKGAERDEVRQRRGPDGQQIIDIAVSDSISSGRQDQAFERFSATPRTVKR